MVRYNGEDEDNSEYFDDDYIGFVFGYKDSGNYILLEWRGGYSYSPDSGFKLIRYIDGIKNLISKKYTPSTDDTYSGINKYECAYKKRMQMIWAGNFLMIPLLIICQT